VAKGGQVVTGLAAWTDHYASWAAAAGLASKVGAFVTGSANMIESLGIPVGVSLVIMGVFVASFAGTTLDTATRVQRYVVAELASDLKMDFLTGRHAATFIAVGTAAFLAFFTGASGKGALKLWPLFGATNQTLAALALIVATVYLKAKGGAKWMVTGLPAAFMLVMTVWALVLNQTKFYAKHNMLLVIMNLIILVVALWIAVEGLIKFFSVEPPKTEKPEPATT
jgi:carbon starvation protein